MSASQGNHSSGARQRPRGAGIQERHRTARGFTLLELLVSVVLLMILMASVFPLISGAINAHQIQQLNADAIANARFAMDRIGELARNAGHNPRRVNFLAVSLGAGGSSLALQSDLNGDADTNDSLVVQDVVVAPESVLLDLDGTNLVLSDQTVPNPAPVPLAQNIQALVFARPSANVLSVTVTACAPSCGAPGVRRVTLAENIFLRNLP